MKHSLESLVLFNFYASQDGLLSPNNLLFVFFNSPDNVAFNQNVYIKLNM